MEPKVLNIKRIKGSWPENTVRVDRRSRWGNPFVMRNGSEAERKRVCDAFEEMATNWPPETIAALKKDLKGKNLACWCSPKKCHADTLLRIANEEQKPQVGPGGVLRAIVRRARAPLHHSTKESNVRRRILPDAKRAHPHDDRAVHEPTQAPQ